MLTLSVMLLKPYELPMHIIFKLISYMKVISENSPYNLHDNFVWGTLRLLLSFFSLKMPVTGRHSLLYYGKEKLEYSGRGESKWWERLINFGSTTLYKTIPPWIQPNWWLMQCFLDEFKNKEKKKKNCSLHFALIAR